MAADPNPDWVSCLPSFWSYGVIQDGRVFFINEEAKSTTWLHPVTGEAVNTGHRKTSDLPTGWEEGYTFEGARCFIDHNERKVTCKHPVTGVPSQDNCIFVVNEQPAPKAPATEKKERPTSIMSEASNYTGGSDYTTHQSSPTVRQSRSLKKVHNFGKRSNSIRRNPNALVVKRNWMYKQDSAGMKMWKKRWFVLSDMCLFYYKDEKEEGILGSILLPSFHVSMLSVDDHISKKYAFKATHPNMRSYYFSTDTAKEMESWMKVMTDAALVQTEPIKRMEKIKVDPHSSLEINNMNHWGLTQPEIRNNERNRENLHIEDKKQKQLEKQPKIHREKERNAIQDDPLQKEGRKYAYENDGQNYAPQKDGDKYMPQKELEKFCVKNNTNNYTSQKNHEQFNLSNNEDQYLQHDEQRYTLKKNAALHKELESKIQALQKDCEKYLQKDERRSTQDVMLKETEKPRLHREGDKYGFQKDGSMAPSLTKSNSIKLQPVHTAAIAATVSSSWQQQQQSRAGSAHYKAPEVNGSGEERSPEEMDNADQQRASLQSQEPADPQKGLSRTNSMQQLEQWVRTHRTRVQDEDTRSITFYQTLPRNMPSHRTQVVPKYPEGYRTLPRNMLRPDSISSVAGSVYDCALPPTAAAKRRSMRDDTLWQLYEWQQRQAYSRMGYSTLPSPSTMSQIAESIPSSPSHGSLAMYHPVSPNQPYNPSTCSEVSSPVFRGDVSLDRRHRARLTKYAYPPECRASTAQSITPQSLQDKTPEELTLLLIKLRRQQAELNSVREQTLAQLMQLNLDASNPKNKILSHHRQRNLMCLDRQMKENEPIIFMIHTMIENSAPRPQLYQQIGLDGYRENMYGYRTEELDIDTKLSRLCEQGKVVQAQEEKLQQLHREKHTLETALLSASQEIEISANNPAAVQSLIQQRDVLQSGLLSTCREVSRVNTELDRSWKEYDKLEADVISAKKNLLEQLEALGSPQTEPPSQQHVQIQKELWRIQDVMDALYKNKPKRSTDTNSSLSSLQKSEGPDYRLYKSEPELTTVTEVDESNGEDKSEQATEKEPSGSNGVSYPVRVASPRTKSPMPVSSTIASYVTLRKSKKPEPKTDRPHSVVDQISSGVEGTRQRMSVEEQMERIRRHQQGTLRERERRREDGSLSRSLSFTKDRPFYYTLQTGTKRREMTAREPDHLRASITSKETCKTNGDKCLSTSEPGEKVCEASRSPEQQRPKEPSADHHKTLLTEDSLQTAMLVRVGTEENDEEENLSERSQDRVIKDSHNITTSRVSTMVSAQPLISLNTTM
ncbi:pleckstrin homology domain-containing family A member 5 isoform X2 [Trichomycterus rosablanca]|uniref:pleckstrin homology domain-containing family A member 5 isoform X2 n=1 Tax=Trichomycterus rosablanca TaxID=2290929 RepID=UPI002F3523C8